MKYTSKASPTLLLLVVIATLGALGYLLFIINPEHAGDALPYAIVVIAELFIITQALITLWTILSGDINPRNYGYHSAQNKLLRLNGRKTSYREALFAGPDKNRQFRFRLDEEEVTVDVFITVYGEDPQIVEDTAKAAKNIIGKHRTILLDDGNSETIRQLAENLGIEYVARDNNHNAKAGNINNALKIYGSDFFVVFDADFVPQPDFLYETLPFFEDSNIAFVQTPQYYKNANNTISKGAGYMQSLFYTYIMPGKNRFNSAFCVGTNVVFRRQAIDEIGGIYDKSKSEDIWTSLLLHENGWRSVYMPDILAVGHTPDKIETYSKQQLRWATGGMEIFLKRNPLLNRSLNIDQKIQYFTTCAYYLYGVAIMGLLLLPVLHVFFNLSPVDISVSISSWTAVYLGFYGLQILLAFYAMGGFRLETLILAMVSFPIYVKAFFNALFRRDHAWSVTGQKSGYLSPFNFIVPQLFIFLFLLFTAAVALWKSYFYETVSVSLVWVLINATIFGYFMLIARREGKQIKQAKKHAASTELKPQRAPRFSLETTK